jgi:hypothetical protein
MYLFLIWAFALTLEEKFIVVKLVTLSLKFFKK